MFSFLADQTPTPTRFIRNCEEVGLFQDLQHENPFDETFRRAVEAGKTCVLASEVDFHFFVKSRFKNIIHTDFNCL